MTINIKSIMMTIVFMAAGFVSSFSQSLLTSALPAIMKEFSIDAAIGQWLTIGYMLIMGSMTALSAYMFYRFHTKMLVQISVIIFMAACCLAIAAPNFWILLLARCLQAIGAGPLMPLLQTVVLYIFPKELHGTALGLVGIVVGFAPTISPTISGILIDHFGWRSVFVMLLIFCAIVLVLSQLSIQEIGDRRIEPLAIGPVILYSLGFSGIMIAVTMMKNGLANILLILLLGIGGAVMVYIFIMQQLRSDAPILNFYLMKDRCLSLGCIIICLMYSMNLIGTMIMPMYNQTVNSYSATQSGLIMIPGSLSIAVLSTLVGRIVDKFSGKAACIAGMVICLSGNIMCMTFKIDSSATIIAVIYLIRCIGITFLMTAGAAVGVQNLSMSDKPQGTAIIHSVRQMCGTLGSTIFIIIGTSASVSSSGMDLRGVHATFICCIAASLIGLFASLRLPSEH